jgi:hypothetical protein
MGTMQPHPRPLRLTVLAVLLALAALIPAACGGGSRPADTPRAGVTNGPTPAAADAQTSGTADPTPSAHEEAPAAVPGPIPVAVMIDNFPWDTRPQIGLDKADVVYEFLVEGGVTRFMAVYQSQEAERIRPVRSARTPSVLLAAEWDALLAHVGAAEAPGAANATRRMREWQVRDLDGDAGPGPFWRERDRPAPHNMATSTGALRARAAELGWAPRRQIADWQRAEGGDGRADGTALRVAYNFKLEYAAQPQFAVAWTYDEATRSYRRAMAGEPHRDGVTGEQLAAKNVVVQLHQARVATREGHVLYEQIGEGSAVIFRDGTAVRATWTKRSPDDRTRYWYPDGTEVALEPGATWVALLPEGSPLGWS